MSFTLFTDSGCDISPALLAEWGVKHLPLTFRFQDAEQEYTGDDMPSEEFYAQMRNGRVAKTAAINSECFMMAFEEELKEGKDVLYLGFSSGLSTTYNSSRLAALELNEKYPDRKVVVVDTLCASAGQGLLVYLTVEQIKNGATLEEAAAFAEGNKAAVSHWFTVSDLVYLKRGGRVSATSAFIGNALAIKPVLHVDDAGKLVNVQKAMGRKKSIADMAQKYTDTALDAQNGTVFISHADCQADAQALADMLNKKHGASVAVITNIGPVIGAHAGPGTLALFFMGKQR